MKYKHMSISIIGLLAIFFALAANASGLAVTGATLIENVNPGQEINHEMTVSVSETESAADIIVGVYGFGQDLYGGNVLLDESHDTSPYTARPFLNVSPSSFHLEPGTSQSVMLAGQIPVDVGAGGRYALVSISTLPTGGKGSIGVSTGVNVPVALTIKGTQKISEGEIMSLNLDEPISPKVQELSLIFNNTGNYYYKPKVKAVLKDESGAVLAEAETSAYTSIIPTNSRAFCLSLKPAVELSAGSYSIEAKVMLRDGTLLDDKEIAFEI